MDGNIYKVYSAGHYTHLYKEKLFYIDEELLNSDLVITDCIDSLLNSKYTGYTFYIHNFSMYDSAFILKTLVLANYNRPENYKYKLSPIIINGKIISFSISIKHKTKPIRLR